MQEIEMLKIEEMIRSGVMNGIIFHFFILINLYSFAIMIEGHINININKSK